MRFKEFYVMSNDEKTFNKVFEKFYARGYFGKIDKELVKENQKDWFKQFSSFLEHRDEKEVLLSLLHKENKITREYFTEITGVDVKYKRKQDVVNLVKNFFSDVRENYES